MKVLVYDEWIPWPLDCGKKIRTYNLLKQLSNQHDIIFLSYIDINNEEYKIKQLSQICYKYVPVTDVRIKKWSLKFYLDVFKHFFKSEPYSSTYNICKEYACSLKKVIADEQPDVIHCEWSNLAPYLNYAGEIPTIITFHNIEADIWKRLGESGTNLIKKIIGKNQATKMAQFEKNWYPKANCCIAVSELDKSVMVKYGARVTVVENGVDLDYYKAVNPKVEDNCISFTASFDTFSNQDGVFFFFDEIYPKLINNCSGLKVVLIGKSPPRKFYDYQNIYKNIFITGTVNDIRKYAAKSQISIVPLRIGGGTRLKILEAMAMKIPVVSTTVGAEGLMVTNGKDIILADNPTEFADNVIKLLNNQNMRYSLIENGLKLVTEKYDWKSLAKKQHQAWSTVKDINKKPKTL